MADLVSGIIDRMGLGVSEVKAFASWGGPIATTAYADELAARKVLCICTVSQPIEYYTARAPYVISTLPARLPVTQGDAYRVHAWHHGSPPPAKAAHGLIYTAPWIFYTGLHLGGPNVTPESIREGLFRFPPTGRGSLTNVHVSFGRHGVWPFDDYLANDDATEVWWDGTATGDDEVGKSGLGMYRYVEGGRRYLPGQHPTTDPFVFARDRTVTIYSEPPPGDRPPSYEHNA